MKQPDRYVVGYAGRGTCIRGRDWEVMTPVSLRAAERMTKESATMGNIIYRLVPVRRVRGK